jgi:hypothetical protein
LVGAGLEILTRAGFRVDGFRQPGWGLNADFSLLSVLREAKLRYIAGSSLDGGLNASTQRVSNYYPTVLDGVLNIPQNIELDWPLARMCDEAVRIAMLHGILSIKAHVADRINPNSLTKQNVEKLRRFLDFLETNAAGEIEYATMSDIAAWLGRSLARTALPAVFAQRS